MGDLSRNFSRWEFACKCGCSQDTVDSELISVLQQLSDISGLSTTINCGNRCPEHNKEVGGAPESQHLISKAADIVVSGMLPIEVYNYFNKKYPNKYGIGKYKTFTHIDVRNKKARW